jgi:ABC-type glycerol-3-phosphate transport system permease component
MSAAAVLTTIPTIILVVFASRYIVQKLTEGAVSR